MLSSFDYFDFSFFQPSSETSGSLRCQTARDASSSRHSLLVCYTAASEPASSSSSVVFSPYARSHPAGLGQLPLFNKLACDWQSGITGKNERARAGL